MELDSVPGFFCGVREAECRGAYIKCRTNRPAGASWSCIAYLLRFGLELVMWAMPTRNEM